MVPACHALGFGYILMGPHIVDSFPVPNLHKVQDRFITGFIKQCLTLIRSTRFAWRWQSTSP